MLLISFRLSPVGDEHFLVAFEFFAGFAHTTDVSYFQSMVYDRVGRPLRGGVDRNLRSAPTITCAADGRPLRGGVDRNATRRTARRRVQVAPFAGAWIETCRKRLCASARHVAPFAGAWIETPMHADAPSKPPGRPLRGGVDRNILPRRRRARSRVAPFAGAWIETLMRRQSTRSRQVAPFAGAWIETPIGWISGSRGRAVAPFAGAWIETSDVRPQTADARVAPFAGAWIETKSSGCR